MFVFVSIVKIKLTLAKFAKTNAFLRIYDIAIFLNTAYIIKSFVHIITAGVHTLIDILLIPTIIIFAII